MPSNDTRKRPTMDIVDARVAVGLATKQTYSENVFLFVPNLIGYSRIILAAFSLHYMSYHPKYCTVLYSISCLLDAVDGHAARALGQSSKFGAVLDMVTDRCTTSCLLCYLTLAYPEWALGFQFLITLDFSSHYMHMNSSLVTGSKSHKQVDGDVSNLLRWYYNPTVLFIVCAGNELFYIALYLMKWVHTPLSQSFGITAELATQCTWAHVLLAISAPVWLLKNALNLVQLWKASKVLVGVDLAERAQARAAAAAKKS
ncbi:phosphatidylinositol synthase [Epithele typhae]|uniref:phosphatidylinositol synthase n=1 Tax=Epithele typhae TaxID=378194 RepID=UPI002007FF0C|nr:phosphatidylinositol synthase [Epithele typhae]KAH9946012.1 phosphatidylinositol synthase [Epithele typhae]